MLEASGVLGAEGPSCSVQTGRALLTAGLHPSTGGDGTLACSGDLLLQALVACAGVTLSAVAINRNLAIDGTSVLRANLTCAAPWGWIRRLPWDSAASACSSNWIPMPTTRRSDS